MKSLGIIFMLRLLAVFDVLFSRRFELETFDKSGRRKAKTTFCADEIWNMKRRSRINDLAEQFKEKPEIVHVMIDHTQGDDIRAKEILYASGQDTEELALYNIQGYTGSTDRGIKLCFAPAYGWVYADKYWGFSKEEITLDELEQILQKTNSKNQIKWKN